MSIRRILCSRIGLVATLGAAYLLGGVTVGTVQTAGASGTSTTYHACLSNGAMSKVGTVSPSCPGGSQVISWTSVGPKGPRAPKGPAETAGPPYNCSTTPYPGIDLADCTFTGANLTDAALTGADLAGSNLTSTDLTGANLTGANLTGVTWSDTTCPDGTNSGKGAGATCIGHLST